MKNIVTILLVAICLSGCRTVVQGVKGIKSSAIGLKREIIFYANDGSIINTWEGRINVKNENGVSRIILANNKTLYLSGTYSIEEK